MLQIQLTQHKLKHTSCLFRLQIYPYWDVGVEPHNMHDSPSLACILYEEPISFSSMHQRPADCMCKAPEL
jgi:hypothetical protein